MGLIVCGFPGVGKSTLAKNETKYYPLVEFRDSDSSLFPRAGFPENYLHYIELAVRERGITFISTHKAVLNGLHERQISHVVVAPEPTLKMEYIARYAARGSTAQFVQLMLEKWDEFHADMAVHAHECRLSSLVYLSSGQTLEDVILGVSLIGADLVGRKEQGK